jgi:hypothetical protein
VAAVILNVTATSETTNGYLTVYPTGSTIPEASNLNTHAGITTANLATVPLGSNGQVSIYNFSGSTDLIVDAEGYYLATQSPGTPSESRYVPLSPARIVDTRCSTSPQPAWCPSEHLPAANASLKAIPPNGALNFTAAGIENVPISGAAAELNVTVISGKTGGYLTLYPAETPRPVASNLNFTSDAVHANQVVAVTGSSGMVSVYNSSSSPVDVVVDLEGYYSAAGSTAGYLFTPSPPSRILDTRCSTVPAPSYCTLEDLPAANSSIPPASPPYPLVMQVAGDGSIPLTGVAAVVVNVTVVSAPSGGYLSIYPDGETTPTISNLNFTAGETISNMAVITLPAGGKADVYSSAKGATNIVIDVLGWYSSD